MPNSLRRRAPRERIVAIADPGSVQSVDAWFDTPRPSPHLARWGIAAQDDDGVVIARATLRGAPVLFAAQDERFVGGSVGANHGDALRRLFLRAGIERPAAVVVLAASGGVRLYEANPAEWELARAVAALLDLRASGVAVIAVGVGNTFGGSSVLAFCAERTALLQGVLLGVSGPAVIETARGSEELDARDAKVVTALFGAEARARAGHVQLLADDADEVRGWAARSAHGSKPFGAWVLARQERLASRLTTHALPEVAPALEGHGKPVAPIASPPIRFASLYAGAEPVDRAGWLWRVRDRPLWLTRPSGPGTFGPREAHELDAALLAHLATAGAADPQTIFLVEDSSGHEVSRRAEALCVSQYLAQHAAVMALLRAGGVRLRGLVAGVGHSAAFFANALQAQEVYAVAQARVVAMEPESIARVTKVPKDEITALIEEDPLLGHPVRHFSGWGGVAEIFPDFNCERLLALAAREIATPLASR